MTPILDLTNPLLIPFEKAGYVFVWPECAECCGWQPKLICELKDGEEAYNLAGEITIVMARVMG
jgi:hypothetical protein